MNHTTYYGNEGPRKCGPYSHYRFFSWSGVFAGALVGIGLGFLFNLLNLALGFFVLTTDSGKDVGTLAAGGIVWLIICAIITMFFTGWIAGKIARCCYYKRSVGILHGFCAWCVALIFTLMLLTHLGSFFSMNKVSTANTTVSSPVTVVDQNAPGASTTTLDASDKLTVNEKVADISSKSAFGLFLIFLIGAISSCIGGYVGIGGKKIEHYTEPTTTSGTGPGSTDTNRFVP